MFDQDKFADILYRINSTYDTMTDFGKRASFDRTYISKYINKKLENPPSPKILKKIADASNGITTYNELMFLCGYTNHYQNNYIYSKYETIFYQSLYKLREIGLTDDEIEQLKNICLFNTKNNSLNMSISQFVTGLPKNIQEDVTNFYDTFINENYFGILSEEKLKSENNHSNSAVVFVYGTIPAGIPIECIEDILDTEEIPSSMLNGGKQYFGLRVKGNSMYPDYLDGDTLIIEKQDDCESGDDCIVMVNGYDGTFKRVIKNEEAQTIRLQPLNTSLDENGMPLYEPITFTKEQIEQLPVRILGVVVEIRRKKRRK